MRNGRFPCGWIAGLAAAALLLAGCGTARPGGPSARDPANLAPANALLYASVTVRPQGGLATQIRQTLTKLAGPGAESSILASLNRSLGKHGMSYQANLKPWLGQRVGLVLTEPPPTGFTGSIPPGMALIMPTRDPSAAWKFLRRLIRRTPGTEGRVAGGYAVYGGALAYQQTLGLSPSASLADSPGYRSTMSELHSGTAASVYVNLHRFAQIEAQKSQLSGSLGGLFRQSLSRIGPNAALAAGVTMAPSAIRVDAVETGVRRRNAHASPDVGALPAGSWLALSTGWLGGSSQKQFRAGLQLGLANSLGRDGLSGAGLANALTQRLGFLENDVFPALGPLSLAVGGTSPLNLTLGLKLTPSKLSAATRVLAMLRGLAARSSSLSVSGTASHFSVRVPTGSQLVVEEIRRAVVATYGFANPSAFLAPTSRLSGDPTFRRALAQMPGGSHVPLYVSFGPIAALVGLLDRQPSAARTVRTLNKLSYLIAGSSGSRTAVVLGLR